MLLKGKEVIFKLRGGLSLGLRELVARTSASVPVLQNGGLSSGGEGGGRAPKLCSKPSFQGASGSD